MGYSPTKKLSLWALLALVIGSMLDSGIFSLPATFAKATGGLGAIIAWCIAGCGMLMLVFVFQGLSHRKPELDGGVFTYAKAGFGSYMGFMSAFSFWAGSCVGSTSYFILIKSTLGAFYPVFGDGNTIAAVVVSSMLLWGLHFLILRGTEGAATVNGIATFAKVVFVIIFLAFVIWAFDSQIFINNFLGNTYIPLSNEYSPEIVQYGFVGHASEIMIDEPNYNLFSQVRNILLITVYVFLGIDGASIYSRFAKNRKDVGAATLIGFLVVLCLFTLVTLLSYGILERTQLAALRQPSMAAVLERIIGSTGVISVSVALIVTILGAYLSWTILAAELLFTAAKHHSMPAFLGRENKKGTPYAAVWLTTLFIQINLIISLHSEYAYGFILEFASALCLFPYLLVASYALKLTLTRETYDFMPKGYRKDLIITSLATAYAALMIYVGGMKYILLSTIIYVPGSLLFFIARYEQNKRLLNQTEKYIFIALAILATVAILCLSFGVITI